MRKLKRIKKEKLDVLRVEGYKSECSVDKKINKEWEAATIEGWPDRWLGWFEVFISGEDSGLTLDSKIKCNQIRTVDKLRLLKLVGEISAGIIKKVEEALLIHVGISKMSL